MSNRPDRRSPLASRLGIAFCLGAALAAWPAIARQAESTEKADRDDRKEDRKPTADDPAVSPEVPKAAAPESPKPDREVSKSRREDRKAAREERKAERTDSPADRDRRAAAEELGEARGRLELLEIQVGAQKDVMRMGLRLLTQAQFGLGGGIAANPSPEEAQRHDRRFKEVQTRIEEAKDQFLALSRELALQQQRVADLESRPTARRRPPAAAPPLERRLEEIEHKLDALLNAPGRPGPDRP